SKKIPDSNLTNFFKELDQKEIGVYFNGKKFKIKFIKQIKTSPPIFLIFSNMDAKRKVNLRKYIENNIREKFGFMGTPIYLKFKH
ncbi:MAG: hypothetical protein KJ821_04380, partial [Actinobacteria bacterium]|nr:hypothetical protein [Actinomycetota bacterium]